MPGSSIIDGVPGGGGGTRDAFGRLENFRSFPLLGLFAVLLLGPASGLFSLGSTLFVVPDLASLEVALGVAVNSV